jgi:dihydrofolate reductase
MRKLIAGMKLSVDGKIEGPEGYADWVEGWSDDYGLTSQIDACLLGANMYRGYEQYWTAIINASDKPLPMTGRLPTPGEVDWGFVRGLDEVAALKEQPGKDIYLMGGARTAASLIDAGLVDELRLIVYPLIAGDGKPLFATMERRRGLELRKVQELPGGRVNLTFGIR